MNKQTVHVIFGLHPGEHDPFIFGVFSDSGEAYKAYKALIKNNDGTSYEIREEEVMDTFDKDHPSIAHWFEDEEI